MTATISVSALPNLVGANGDISETQALEAYYRLPVNDHLALTADLQYMRDGMVQGADPDVAGFLFGGRGTLEY